jgi:DNA-binding HxlR family transcriptional regulator
MKQPAPDYMQCPVARTVERVGDVWSLLILRDATQGITRFDQFQKGLGIGTNILTNRLGKLVEAGLLERHRYSERPPRDEYRLTERGRDFQQVLWALNAFGNRHFATEGKAVMIVDRETGAEADPILVDRHSGRPMTRAHFRTIAGPVANATIRQRYANPTTSAGSAS